MKIRDLITLPPIKTVVQLHDAKDPELRRRLVEQFVLTDEVRSGLEVILRQISRGQGQGFFLKGHYGAGKSHFLAYLSLIVAHAEFRRAYEEKLAGTAETTPHLEFEGLMPVNLSLVDYRSSFRLEDIVVRNALETLDKLDVGGASEPWSGAQAAEKTRRQQFDEIFRQLEDAGFQGILLLIDELSEFLRSKPSSRAFNEDIRYLQFLGEYSSQRSLWIVAALQEFVEETGEVSQQQFNKIKDRYPARIVLTASHVKSLVGELLVRKKPGAEEYLKPLYRKFCEYFPDWRISEKEFLTLFPLHPASIELLEELKPLFSKTRGFVDFIHYQIGGDKARGITGILDEPGETLLCPDRIFDHFLDRMKSTIEILPYIETVFAHYLKEAGTIVPDERDRRFAIRLIKLLILQHVSPLRREFSVAQLTEMLLERITDIDPDANYEYTADIGDLLVSRGGYLVASQAPGQPRRAKRYRIQIEANVNFILERKLEHKRQALADQGQQVLGKLFPQLASRSSFFRDFRPGTRQVSIADWQNTRRTGTVAKAGSEKSSEPTSGQDFDLIVLLPGQDFQEAAESLESGVFCSAVLSPAELKLDDRSLSMLALLEVHSEYGDDNSTQARRIRDLLEKRIEETAPVASELFERAYRKASLHDPTGQLLFVFEDISADSFAQLLEKAVHQLLDSRFPKHYLIAPRQNYYPKTALAELGEYFRSMSAESFGRLAWGRTVLDGFLLPTGILKRQRNNYRFAAGEQESAPLNLLVDYLRQNPGASARQALSFLASSEYGMGELQFRAFLWAALWGGFLAAKRGGRKLPVGQINPEQVLEIEVLERGETVSAGTVAVLQRLEIIPQKLRKSSLSYTECVESWKAIQKARIEAEEKQAQLTQLLRRYQDYRAFALIDQRELKAARHTVQSMIAAIRSSAPAVDGLEHFAANGPDPEELNRCWQKFGNAHDFFTQRFSMFSFLAGYIQRAQDALPKQPDYASLGDDLTALAGQLAPWNPCSDPSRLEELHAGFEKWQQIYLALYDEEHGNFQRQQKSSPVREVLESPELRLLGRLERLQSLVSDVSSASIRKSFSERFSSPCERAVWEELQQRPVCSCGYRLGQQPKAPTPEPTKEIIHAQLTHLWEQIRHPRFQELLDRFEFHLGRGGDSSQRDSLAAVRLLQKADSLERLTANTERLSAVFVDRLNAFEPDRKPFEVKYLSHFRKKVGSRPRTTAALVENFREWLSEGLSEPDQPLKLLERPANDELQSDRLALLLDRFPLLRSDFQRLSREEFSARLFSADLAHRYQLEPETAGKLPLLPQVELAQDYRDLAKALPTEAWVELADELEAFEERLGDSGYEALGLPGDSVGSLLRVLHQEARFPGLARRAAQRLLKKLDRLSAKSLTELEAELPADWLSGSLEFPRDELSAYGETVASLLRVRSLAEELRGWDKKPQPNRRRSTFETVFDRVAPAAWIEDRLNVLLQQTALADCVTPRNQLSSLLENLFTAFQQSLEQNQDKLPRTEQLLASELPRLAEKLGAESSRLLFVDALSWPLWKRLEGELEKRLPPQVRVVETRMAYARVPSDTLEQVKHWLAAGAPAAARKLQKGFTFAAGPEEGLYKLDWVDEKIHSSRESPYFLYTEIAQQLCPQLVGMLSKLPRNTLFALFSDHGFTENAAFQSKDKYRFPRYRHGGATPFEVVVPFVVFFSGSGPQGH